MAVGFHFKNKKMDVLFQRRIAPSGCTAGTTGTFWDVSPRGEMIKHLDWSNTDTLLSDWSKSLLVGHRRGEKTPEATRNKQKRKRDAWARQWRQHDF